VRRAPRCAIALRDCVAPYPLCVAPYPPLLTQVYGSWKLVHADVFRPPTSYPMLLAVACGTGMQVLLCSLASIFFSAIGFISPAYRGGLIMALLMFYCLCGAAAGYTTARLYKSFKGKLWQRATALTAVMYPGMFFATFFFLNLINWYEGSTDAVPFFSMLVVVVLWFGIR